MKKHLIWLVMGLLLVAGLPMASAQSGETINRQNLNQLSIVATIEANYAEDIDLSSSGRLLALAEGFNEVRVYDLDALPDPLVLLTVPDFGVQAVAISPDETLLAAGTTEGRIYIVDIPTQSVVATLEGHEAYVLDVAWSDDGSQLASAGDDSTIIVWEMPNGTAALTLDGHQDWVRSLAWSPDGSRLASVSDDQVGIVWNAASGTNMQTLAGHFDWVRSVAWSPNGRLIATGSDDGRVLVWDGETGNLLMALEGHRDFVRSIAFGADSDVIFSASDDSTVRAWDPSNPDGIAIVLEGEFVQFLSLSVSEEGNRLAVGSDDGRITVLGIN